MLYLPVSEDGKIPWKFRLSRRVHSVSSDADPQSRSPKQKAEGARGGEKLGQSRQTGHQPAQVKGTAEVASASGKSSSDLESASELESQSHPERHPSEAQESESEEDASVEEGATHAPAGQDKAGQNRESSKLESSHVNVSHQASAGLETGASEEEESEEQDALAEETQSNAPGDSHKEDALLAQPVDEANTAASDSQSQSASEDDLSDDSETSDSEEAGETSAEPDPTRDLITELDKVADGRASSDKDAVAPAAEKSAVIELDTSPEQIRLKCR